MDSSKQAAGLKEPPRETPADPPQFTAGGSTSLDHLPTKLISTRRSFMAYSFFTAVHNSRKDPANLAFVAGSFGLLYLSMWEFERTRSSSPSRKKHFVLRAIIWVLSATLTAVFARRVTTIIYSLAVDVFVWTVAALTSACSFYFLFIMS